MNNNNKSKPKIVYYYNLPDDHWNVNENNVKNVEDKQIIKHYFYTRSELLELIPKDEDIGFLPEVPQEFVRQKPKPLAKVNYYFSKI